MSEDKDALSQDQIDALLGGDEEEGSAEAAAAPAETAVEPAAEPAEPAAEPVAAPAEPAQTEAAGTAAGSLTASEIDAIGEIGNISMGTAATTLSTLVNQKVEITLPEVKVESLADLKSDFPEPGVVLNVEYTEGFKGNNILFLNEKDAAVLASLMMGGDGKPEGTKLDEMQLSAVTESMNQMMGTVATSMASMVDKSINISPPQGKVLDLAADEIKTILQGEDTVVTTRFQLKIEGLLESKIVQIQPVSFAKELVESLVSKHAPEGEAPAAPPPSAPPGQAPPAAAAPPAGGQGPPPATPVEVQKPEFPDFGGASLSPEGTRNLDLLMDVRLQVSAELGRTKMTIKDILELGAGSVVELERYAGEPIDVLVNNRLMARAEVVVIDESFGVRITDIVSQEERLRTLSDEAE